MLRQRVRYGPARGQVGNWLRPGGTEGRALPTVVLIHGGSWRYKHTKVNMRLLARVLVRAGYGVWNIEYRRVGRLSGGGWPTTLQDVSAAVDAVAGLPGADVDRVITVGHSAGGQLALWAAARPRVDPTVLPLDPKVRVRGAVSLAGALDLAKLARGREGDAVTGFLGGTPDEHPERYAAASPWELLPLGVPHSVIHGLADQLLSPIGSERYARRATALGDDVRFVGLPRVAHGSIIAGRGAPTRTLLAEVARVLGDGPGAARTPPAPSIARPSATP